MADEAYRAVFLRVHPTGKMVLSLTTEPDGREQEYAQVVADELGVPALDVKVKPADTDRFGDGHGYNTAPSGGAPAAIADAAEKIRAKARLLAGMALGADPNALTWQNGAWANGVYVITLTFPGSGWGFGVYPTNTSPLSSGHR